MVVLGQIMFYSCKVVVFKQKWLYSTKSGYIRAKFVLFGQNCLHWNKVVVFGLKKCFLPTQLERRCGPTATVTSLKVTWNEGPDNAL